MSPGSLRSLLRLQPDDRLAALAHAGHEEAFAVIVSRHRAAMARTCRRVLGEGDADDALQRALIAAHRALLREPPRDLRPWLMRIAFNSALAVLAERKGDTAALDELMAGGETPDAVVERRDAVRRLVAGITGLPEAQRRAIVAREFEGRGYEDIARELQLSEGAVRGLIFRARGTLRAAAAWALPPQLLSRMLGTESAALGQAPESALAAKLAAMAVAASALAGGTVVVSEQASRSPDRPEQRRSTSPLELEEAQASVPAPSATPDPSSEAADGRERAGSRSASDDGKRARRRRGRGSDDREDGDGGTPARPVRVPAGRPTPDGGDDSDHSRSDDDDAEEERHDESDDPAVEPEGEREEDGSGSDSSGSGSGDDDLAPVQTASVPEDAEPEEDRSGSDSGDDLLDDD